MFLQRHLPGNGFTLIELMVAIAVLGVLLSMALPSYQGMLKNNCLTTNTNTLVTSFQQARSEAIKRRTKVEIRALSSDDTANEWGGGWNINVNEDANGNGTLDAGEDFDGNGTLDSAALFRAVRPTCANTTIDNQTNSSSYFYRGNGFINRPATFNVCDDRKAERGRQISINAVGRPNTNSSFECS